MTQQTPAFQLGLWSPVIQQTPAFQLGLCCLWSPVIQQTPAFQLGLWNLRNLCFQLGQCFG